MSEPLPALCGLLSPAIGSPVLSKRARAALVVSPISKQHP